MKRILMVLFSLLLIMANIEYEPVFATEVTGYNNLNNGYIQFNSNFGPEWQNLPITAFGDAVNDFGNLNNPYYFDGTVWRPLTLSRKMEYAVSEGGTLVSESDPYNVTGSGTILYPATNSTPLSNFTVDGTGITMKEQTTTAGSKTYTGTLISKGELNVNGKNLEFTNTYTLLEGKSFVRVKTRIKNLSDVEATNVRYWVGTGDDWISTNDVNFKYRGNIIDGAFVTSTNPSEQSKAIRVDTQTHSDSILFYSTHPKANTAVNSCCSFSTAVNTNPMSSTVSINNDGSYALFVNLGTIAPGAYQDFDWYYAAGSAATIIDVIDDVAIDSSGASNVTVNSATIAYTSETTTTGYYMVVPRGSDTPTANQIIGTEEYTTATVIRRGNSIMNAGVETPFEITELIPGSNYDVYFVTRNSENVTSSISLTQFSTQENVVINLLSITSIDVPRNNRVPDTQEIDTAQYTASVSWSPEDANYNDGVVYTATITITPKLGYILTGVAANAFSVTGATATNLINDGVITAIYPAVPLDHVYFHSNGGTSISSVEYDINQLLSEPLDVSRQGYEFAGWFEDNNTFSNPWDFTTEVMPSSDLDLYAKWNALDQTTTFKANGGIGLDVEQVAKTDSTTTLITNSFHRSGYSFIGWSLNSSATSPTYTDNQSITWFNTNTNLYAIWSANNQTITFNANGGAGSNTTQVAKTDSSTSLNLNSFTKEGYSFIGWSQNSSATTPDYTDGQTVNWFNGNTYLYAVWAANDQTITFKANGGVGDDTTQTAKSDSNTALYANPFTKPGYSFAGWSLDPSATEATYSNQQQISWFNHATNLYAVWNIRQYTVDFVEGGGSSVADLSVSYNTVISKPTNPTRNGYTFAGWINDQTSNLYDFDEPVVSDLILRARWNIDVYTINYDLAGGVSNLPVSYTILDTINLIAPIRAGYTFNGWYLGDTAVTVIPSGTTGSINLVARWTIKLSDPILETLSVDNVLIDSAQIKSKVLDFGNPKAVAFGYELTNIDSGVMIDVPTDSNLTFTLTNLEPYTNYSIRVYANYGSKVIYTNEVEFKTMLPDADTDGVPDSRDIDPENANDKTNYTEVSYDDLSALTIVGEFDETESTYRIQINPIDLIDLNGNDTIKVKMGSIEYTIPVALVDDMFSEQSSGDAYLELVVTSELTEQLDLNVLDSVNMRLLNAYDYNLFLVHSNGTSEEIHTFNGKIKVSINLDDIEENIDPSDMEVYYYDSDTETLTPKDAEYDSETNSLMFYTDHFSYYVLGTKQESSFPLLWFGLGFIIISGLLIILFKRRKSKE